MNVSIFKSFALALALLAVASPAAAAQILRYTFRGNALDVSGNGNHGTIHGNPAFVAGEGGSAIYFNNPALTDVATQYVELPNSPSITSLGSSSFTLAIRYKSTDASQNNGRLFGIQDGDGKGIAVNYNAGATPEAYGTLLGTSGNVTFGNPSGLVDPNAVTTDGNWHWLVLTHDVAAQQVKFYIDTNLIDTESYAALGAITFVNATLGRFTGPGASDTSYGARETTVQDLQLFDTALSESQVLTLVTTPVPEPSTLTLLSLASAGLLTYCRSAARRRNIRATRSNGRIPWL